MSTPLNHEQMQQLRAGLLLRQQRLEQELDGLLGHQSRAEHAREQLLQDGDGNGQRESALDAEREVDLARSDLTLQSLREVRAALAALDGDGFGLCQDCGDAIAFARLLASPEARRCVSCQGLHEGQATAHAQTARL
ncbi:TraR/DksA family transcriptional regulator [Paucibacter sp. DJ2R-2]|uniref:TraR/DksA family transcriptional regulator n=1 Tax=Paucibacter sp. DJ2R-2 TaxID=2893558 RepID=UPI0021E37887|nr:TraR/DksA family transcriptional regulator [Paucibacter sp. DJ2R-2]MCV2421363.1 TraR/DksA family transcriptional regulator [Paucibacter sp. DJ4R-1]MCV2441182.1 TraR/DksA family transcriptional regulator [Paucibacter sp. DJ2R-2]